MRKKSEKKINSQIKKPHLKMIPIKDKYNFIAVMIILKEIFFGGGFIWVCGTRFPFQCLVLSPLFQLIGLNPLSEDYPSFPSTEN